MILECVSLVKVNNNVPETFSKQTRVNCSIVSTSYWKTHFHFEINLDS